MCPSFLCGKTSSCVPSNLLGPRASITCSALLTRFAFISLKDLTREGVKVAVKLLGSGRTADISVGSFYLVHLP